MGSPVYPNMYIFLVAPPGVGKTEVTWRIHNLWESLEDHFVAPTSVTKASLIDTLSDANRRWVTNNPENPVEHFNSLQMAINELGVLIPAYENEFMNTLTDLWDCKHYSERRRTSKLDIAIEKPQLSILGACTPSYLTGVLPEGAWDQGFISRTLLIYSGEQQKRSLFGDFSQDDGEWDALKQQLAAIGNLYGQISWTEDAAALIDRFHLTGGEPVPTHPKLLYYNTRRTVHLIKLCMVASVSRSPELRIREEDFQRAFNWLIEAEAEMPEIFKAMSQGGSGKVIEDVWYYVFQTYNKEGQKPVAKHRIIQFLQERVPVHNIENTIKIMEDGQMIEKRLTGAGAAYIPRGKHANT